MKKVIFSLSMTFLFTACNTLEKKMEGLWLVDQAYYFDEPVQWDLYSNAFNLKENNTCSLPIGDWKYRHTEKEKGTWKGFEENGKTYLKIETENRIFNRTFEVHNLKKVRDTVNRGYVMRMTLIADSLKMDCTNALFE